jgi:hypothetical protein
VGPIPVGAQSSTIQISIDSPSDGLDVTNGARVLLGGWAVDTAAMTGDSGVDIVKVYLDGPMESGTQLGNARPGGARPDVASLLGNAVFAKSGFDFVWTPADLGAGPHVLFVYVHSSVSDGWAYRTVNVNGPAGGSTSRTPSPAYRPLPAAAAQSQGGTSTSFRANPYQGPPTPYGGSFLNTSFNDAANYLGGQSTYGAGYGGYYPLPQPCTPLPNGIYPSSPGGSSSTGGSQAPQPPFGGGCATGSSSGY